MSGLSEVFPCMRIHRSSNKKERLLAERGLELDRKRKNTYFLDERLHTDPKILVSVVDDTLEYSNKNRVHQNL